MLLLHIPCGLDHLFSVLALLTYIVWRMHDELSWYHLPLSIGKGVKRRFGQADGTQGCLGCVV